MNRSYPLLAIPVFLALQACNSNDSGKIQIITGEETDTFSQSPVPTQIVVQAASDDGGAPVTLATASYPTDTIDIGSQDESATTQIAIEGLDANGHELIYGASLWVQYGALVGQTLPVFVQRVGQMARLPAPPTDARQYPTLGLLSGRFLVIGGGSDAATSLTTDVYDFAQFGLLTPAPTLPVVPASMPIVSTVALLLDTSGGAEYYDFSQNTSQSVTAPNGYQFADVAGGQTIYDPSGRYVFVVGATRTAGAPTAAVLQIDTSDTSNSSYVTGALSWLTLSVPRLGASATWVAPLGLVVAGGNATAAGVEFVDVPGGHTYGTQLPYPPDSSVGSGMTSLDGVQYVLLAGGLTPAGGDPGVREINLLCGVSCGPTAWGADGGALPVPIASSFAFTFSPAYALVVGSEPATAQNPGLTHVFTLNSAGATEVPTKVKHTNAAAIESPMASSVLIYGGANEIESFTPAPQ